MDEQFIIRIRVNKVSSANNLKVNNSCEIEIPLPRNMAYAIEENTVMVNKIVDNIYLNINGEK